MSIRRYILIGWGSLLWVVLLGVMALPALAAAPEVQGVGVEDSTAVVATPSIEAVVRGVLNPKAVEPFEAGTYEALYRQSNATCEGGSRAPVLPEVDLYAGLPEEPAAVALTGLAPGTEYTVCLRAENAAKEVTVSTPAVTFTTPVKPETPVTEPPEKVTGNTATFRGELNPSSEAKNGYYFAYSTGGECTTGSRSEPGSEEEATKRTVSTAVTGLEPLRDYLVCLVSTNAAGEETVGNAVPFKTPAAEPIIESESASSVNAGGARLEGVVNPNNQATECKFQYEAEESQLKTPMTVPCEPASFAGIFGGQGVGVTVGLAANTTYYYRVLATNGTGTNKGAIKEFKTAIPPEAPTTTTPATAITKNSATLEGVLNPEGGGEAGSYEFVYRQSASECQKVNPETGVAENETATQTTAAPAGTSTVSAPLEGLEPGTQYTLCLLSRNEAGETALGAPVTFRTLAVLPAIGKESVIEDTATTAKLNAQVDPGGAETTYHFEYDTSPYITSAPHGQSTPESASIGDDNGQYVAAAGIQGLQPGTTYHFRVVATNSQSPAGGTLGPDASFVAQGVGGASALPDGRSYEQVSPPQKDGSEVLGPGGGGLAYAGGDATQASEDGRSVTYITNAAVNAPIGVNPPGNTLSTQLFSTRSTDGWSSQNISVPHKNPVELSNIAESGEEYLRFSPDLSQAILMSPHSQLEPPLAPEIHQEVAGTKPIVAPVGSGQEIYVRNNLAGVFRAVMTSEPLPVVMFEGAAPDLSHVVFEGPAGLDSKYPNAGGLYEWTDGQAQLVSVLPTDVPASAQSLLGRDYKDINNGLVRLSATMHAVSDDGSRVVWSTEGNLYTRDMVTGQTTAIGAGEFEAASSDGSRIFYNNGDLVVFDVADKRQTDLGVTDQPSVEGGVTRREPFLGVSESGTSVYGVSSAVLTDVANGQEEKASAGASNLYLLREVPVSSGSWSVTFITARAEEGSVHGLIDSAPFATQEQRVSPDGRFLAFMSQQSMTGYDNLDAHSGEPDEEVYLYDADTNRLVCASCDPTGARPVGEYDANGQFPPLPVDQFALWQKHWVAASIPGWTPDGGRATTGYQPRSLSDSGRLFFTSSDALVPRDINGRADVYEYEPEGIESPEGEVECSGGISSGSDVYVLREHGCVALISAGTGSDGSVFFDASANGNDVFFTTEDGLASVDRDGTADMYDARVCTQAEPCASSLVSPPHCSTTDSCRTAPSPQPGVFAAPASATFAGAGNPTAPPPTVPRKTTKKTVKCKQAKKLIHGKCVTQRPKKHKGKKAGRDRRAAR